MLHALCLHTEYKTCVMNMIYIVYKYMKQSQGRLQPAPNKCTMICGRESKKGHIRKISYCDCKSITKMPQVSMKARITVCVCVCVCVSVCEAYLCGGTTASKGGQCHCI